MRLLTKYYSLASVPIKCYRISEIQNVVKLTTTQLMPIIQLQSMRHYSKADKQKEKAKNKGIKLHSVQLTEEQVNEIVSLDTMQKKLQKAIDTLQTDYIKNLSLRSTTGSIETIKVDVEGDQHELQDVAQIIRKNPKTIVINMSAFPQAIPSAIKAIHISGMNLNPQQEGTSIFIPVPKVTRDYRLTLAKNAKALFMRCKEKFRDIQTEYLSKAKRNTHFSEDEIRSAQNRIQGVVDEYSREAQKIFETKEKELLGGN